MNLKELQHQQMSQMEKKGKLPKNQIEVVLHLVEEVGEVCEAIRENQSREDFEGELADILWQLNKLCWINNIDLEEIFVKKLEKNASR